MRKNYTQNYFYVMDIKKSTCMHLEKFIESSQEIKQKRGCPSGQPPP